MTTRPQATPAHTPGPWHANVPVNAAYADGCTIREPVNGNMVATVHDPDAYANARLIAQAPALLAALERCIESLECAANDLGEVQFDEKEREKQADSLADTAFAARKIIAAARGCVS